MNILVTGGSGMIGSNLITKLQQYGHTVINVDIQNNADYQLNLAFDDLSIIKEQIDVIFHLAAQPYGKGSEIDPWGDLNHNITATLKLCYFAKQRNIKRIIYTSTMAVYGNNIFASEDSELCPLSNYAVSKLTGEYYIKKFAAEFDMNYTIFRVWNTYGPGQDISNEFKGIVNAFATQVLNSNHIKVTGSLDRFRDIIYVDDVVNALIHSLSFEYSDTFNICNGIKISIQELIETIIRCNNDVIENYTIENVGGHVGDQNGCVGNNKKLLNTGWMPSVTFENGIQQFLTYIKRTL
jgi:UDP-glucose 4-epimerase